jgi:hypothetical protein
MVNIHRSGGRGIHQNIELGWASINLTSDCKLQMGLLEKRNGDKANPLGIDKVREELNLRFEIPSIQSEFMLLLSPRVRILLISSTLNKPFVE